MRVTSGDQVPSRRPVVETKTVSVVKQKKINDKRAANGKGTGGGPMYRVANTHAEGVPHARERLRDDVQHAHTAT